MYQGVTSETEKFEIFRSNARSNKHTDHKRFKRLGGGLYRHKSGSFYAVFRSSGKVVWKKLDSTEREQARKEITDAIRESQQINPSVRRTLTLTELVELHRLNPLGLSPSTLKIRQYLLKRFLSTFPNPQCRVAEISPLQLKV